MALAILVGAAGLGGCGGSVDAATASDAGADGASYGIWSPEAAAGGGHAWDRLDRHAGRVLESARIETIYVEGEGGSTNEDAVVSAVLAGAYWRVLGQYGVGNGAVVGSVHVDVSTFFPPRAVNAGLVAESVVDGSVRALIHPEGVLALPSAANGYVVFLPPGVNVTLTDRGTHTYQTCADVGGYHGFDGEEPYAVVPDCGTGGASVAVSHELAEFATNPVDGLGWFSDADLGDGGEVADLCQERPPVDQGGLELAELWSNADGECMAR